MTDAPSIDHDTAQRVLRSIAQGYITTVDAGQYVREVFGRTCPGWRAAWAFNRALFSWIDGWYAVKECT